MQRSLAPEQIQPAWLILSTEGPCRLDPQHLLDVFARQRRRFAAILAGFTPGDWAARTRCAEWTAHDVVRHLCDCNTILGSTEQSLLDVTGGFDPRTTPCRWPAISASESPGVTLARFQDTTRDLIALARDRLARRQRCDVRLPYGSVDWTVMALHGFWDSWLHERDVLLAAGREHPTDAEATGYATAYGVFIAAAVASMFGRPVHHQQLTLSGDGGGLFDLRTHDAVTLTVTQAAVTGPPAAQVADALGGRAPIPAILGDLPTSTRTALSLMADFFNTPVTPISTPATPGLA
jgi:uncharacterized protein (TIGR03083 family)